MRQTIIALAGVALLSISAALSARPIVVSAFAAAPKGKAPAGVHITDGTANNDGYFRRSDGGGYVWDLQNNGAVGQGTNNAYGSGMYLYININGGNNSFYSPNAGVVSSGNDEIEYGPWSPDGRLRVSRRIKVYSDQALARWMDIYENTTDAPMNVQPWTYINTCWNIQTVKSSSGGGSFGDKDFALATQVNNGGNMNPPALAHILCSKNSKFRPTVQVSSNQVNVRWNFTIPAGGTVIVCHFESQNNSWEDQVKLMSSFKIAKALRDVPGPVRRLIANFNVSGGFDNIDIDRSDKYDSAVLSGEDALHGKILNESFDVEALYGKQTLKADRIVGMVSNPGDGDLARFLLTDGQIVAGRVAGQKLQIQLLAGPTMSVPLERLAQWSFAISQQRPYEIPLPSGMIMLRTGERLSFDTRALKLSFQSLYGQVELDPAATHRVSMDNLSGVHQAVFLNGSTLAGFLQPERLELSLKLGPKLSVSRNAVTEILFNPEGGSIAPMATVKMANGDELAGQLTEGKLVVRTDYGQTDVEPRSLRSLTFSEGHVRAILELWDGTKGLHGDLSSQELVFQISPGPAVRLPISQVQTFWSPYAMPPAEALKEVAQLVAKLNSENWKERQDATEQLIKIGPAVVPVLEGKLDDPDAEVRQRAATIIERVKSSIKAPPAKPAKVSGTDENVAAPVILEG